MPAAVAALTNAAGTTRAVLCSDAPGLCWCCERPCHCVMHAIPAASHGCNHLPCAAQVRALFAVAADRQPSIIFIDEIDSILNTRSAGEHDAARRLKTEFLVQFDGVAAASNARVVVIGATNRPQELDDAVRRRLVKRIYIPLPDAEGRTIILKHLLKSAGVQGSGAALSNSDISKVVRATDGYSASDLTALCKEAAMGPVRELGAAIAKVRLETIRPIKLHDFAAALQVGDGFVGVNARDLSMT